MKMWPKWSFFFYDWVKKLTVNANCTVPWPLVFLQNRQKRIMTSISFVMDLFFEKWIFGTKFNFGHMFRTMIDLYSWFNNSSWPHFSYFDREYFVFYLQRFLVGIHIPQWQFYIWKYTHKFGQFTQPPSVES